MTARPPFRSGRDFGLWIGPGDDEEEGSQVAVRRVASRSSLSSSSESSAINFCSRIRSEANRW